MVDLHIARDIMAYTRNLFESKHKQARVLRMNARVQDRKARRFRQREARRVQR